MDDQNQSITAYQGGPHSVGEEGFLDEKIGTGEGAQAYGHGHYFAEAEPVAQGYRDALAQKRNPTTSINDLIGQMSKNSPESRTPKNIQWYMKQDPMLSPHADDKEVVGHISEALNGQNADGSVSESALDAYGKLTDKFGRNHKGHMHEVSINAHPDHFLDWDKPLSEQSPYIVKSIFDARKDNPTLFNVFKSHFEKDSTGMDFYQSLATQHPNGYQGASEFLQRSDIHGIKYLDASSRSKGEGTRNYVVFDPKRVDIKRRYKDGGEVLPHDDPQRKENLDNWHEDSHPLTKNEDGSPKVYYHGTSKDKDFKKFNVGRHGAWVTDDPKEASMYAEANDSQKTVYNWGSLEDQKHGWRDVNTASRVMPVHVKITKPYTGAMPSHFATTDNYKRAQSNFFDHLRSQGFDGWIPQEQGGLVAVALSNPTQIKSSLGNNGNFDPSKPNINEARGGRIGYDYGGDVRTGDNPGGAADANRPAATSRDADRNYNAGSGTQTAGPSSDTRPDNRPDNSNDRFNIGGGGAPMPPQRGDDSFFGNMGGNIGSVLGGLAFGPIGSIGGRYLGNQFNQPDNSRFEAKNDEFGNPIGNNGGWLDFLGSGNPPAPMTSDNRRDPIIKPIKPKRRILMPDGTYQEVEEGMKSGGVAKSYNRVHNSKIVEHALSKVGVSLHTRRPPS